MRSNGFYPTLRTSYPTCNKKGTHAAFLLTIFFLINLVVPNFLCIFAKEINAYPPLSEYIR